MKYAKGPYDMQHNSIMFVKAIDNPRLHQGGLLESI